jgi:RNA polymerase sigma factor (sigma-70 family)
MTEEIAILEERFVELIARHRTLVRTLCWRKSKHSVDRCAELVQVCYLAIWRNLPKLEAGSSKGEEFFWVVWRCRSAISHHLRRQRLWQSLDELPENRTVADEGNALREQVEELAVGLSPREQRCLQLYLDGYHYDEIAVELGIEINSVYKMRRRIIEKMKQNAGL